MKVGRCADILQGDLGEFRAPSAPDSSGRTSVLILTGSSHVNERLIVAASDSPFVGRQRKRIQRCCLSIKYSRPLIKTFCKFGASMAALLLGKEARGFNEPTGSLPQPAWLFLGCQGGCVDGQSLKTKKSNNKNWNIIKMKIQIAVDQMCLEVKPCSGRRSVVRVGVASFLQQGGSVFASICISGEKLKKLWADLLKYSAYVNKGTRWLNSSLNGGAVLDLRSGSRILSHCLVGVYTHNTFLDDGNKTDSTQFTGSINKVSELLIMQCSQNSLFTKWTATTSPCER